MRTSLMTRAGIVLSVVTLAVSTGHAKDKGQDPGDVLTVGTVGNGTAAALTLPDLGTLRVECAATGRPSVTLDGDAPFTVVKVFEDHNSHSGGLTTYTSDPPDTLGRFGADLWLSNDQGQWRFDYYLDFGFFHPNLPPEPCGVGAIITRIR